MQLDLIRKVVLMCVLLIMATGCTSCVRQADQTTFVIGVWKGREAEIIEELVNRYPGEIASDIRIEAVSQDSYRDRLWGYLLSQSPKWDLALTRSDWVSRWADYGAIRSFDDLNIVVPPGVSKFSYQDEVYGLPLSEDFPVLWMRKDLLEPYFGNFSPVTWDEIVAAAEALSNPPERFGLAIALDQNEVGVTFLQMFPGFGGEIDFVRGITNFNSPPGNQALGVLDLLITQGVIVPDEPRSDQILGLLQDGRAGMGVLWLSESGPLFDCEMSPQLCIDGHSVLSGVVLPHTTSATSNPYMHRSTGLILPRASDYPQEVMDFVQWLSTPDGQLALEEARLQDTGLLAGDFVLEESKPEAGLPFSNPGFSERFESFLNETIYVSIMEWKKPEVALDKIDRFLVEDRNRNSRRP